MEVGAWLGKTETHRADLGWAGAECGDAVRAGVGRGATPMGSGWAVRAGPVAGETATAMVENRLSGCSGPGTIPFIGGAGGIESP